MAERTDPPRIDAMPNDVGEWAERPTDGMYQEPLQIAGEKVDLSKQPRFGPERGSSSSDGKRRAPLRR